MRHRSIGSQSIGFMFRLAGQAASVQRVIAYTVPYRLAVQHGTRASMRHRETTPAAVTVPVGMHGLPLASVRRPILPDTPSGQSTQQTAVPV